MQSAPRLLAYGRATFWSRSRSAYWVKGETSGNVQYVRSVALDCDGDALLVRVEQVGPACHTGEKTCFIAGGELRDAKSIIGLTLAQRYLEGDFDGLDPAPADPTPRDYTPNGS